MIRAATDPATGRREENAQMTTQRKKEKKQRSQRCPRCGELGPRFEGPACFDCLHNGELPLQPRTAKTQ
jgi:hypothetical protein